MSDDKNSLKGIDKGELRLALLIGFLGIFGGLIVYIFAVAKFDITISGTLDVSIFVTIFTAIVMAMFSWIGLRMAQR